MMYALATANSRNDINAISTASWTSSTVTSTSPRALDAFIATLRSVAMKASRALGDVEVTVEDVQDAVEIALMSFREFAVAKAYIIYRQRRTDARRARRALDP